MKRIVFYFFLGIASQTLSAQTETYYVIHLKGTILNQTTGKTLKVGDKLNATDKIKYNPDNSGAVVMSSQKGRFTIGKPQGERPSAAGEFIALVRATMIPSKSNGQLSTRGGEGEGIIDLRSTFGNQVFVFPGSFTKFVLNPQTYPINNNNLIVYSFNYNGKLKNRPVKYSKDTLIFDKKDLYVADGQPVPIEDITEVTLYQFNKLSKESKKLVTFKPVFVENEKALLEEIDVLIKMYKGQKLSENEILDQLAEHLTVVYGGENAKTDKQMLSLWLKERMLKL